MGNVIDYLIQYGDQAFAERAFCDVDVLILAQLSYFDFGSAAQSSAQHSRNQNKTTVPKSGHPHRKTPALQTPDRHTVPNNL